jgi:hypothetical protein
MARQTVYLGRDNEIGVVLYDDSSGTMEPIDFSGVTKILIRLDGETFDSVSSPELFDTSYGNGKLFIYLGGASLPVGSYHMRIILYDPVHTNGIVWPTITVSVAEG